jgi:hypothetical protein
VSNTSTEPPSGDFRRKIAHSQPELGFDPGLAEWVAALPVGGCHAPVAEALSQGLPGTKYHLALEATDPYMYRDGRVVGADGVQIAESAVRWIEQEVGAAGAQWRERFRQLQQLPFRRTSVRIVPLVFVARVGARPADFLQAVVYCEGEYPAKEFLKDVYRLDEPADAWRLQDGVAPDESQPLLAPKRYRLRQLEHVGSFVERDAALRREHYPALRATARARRITLADEQTGKSVATTFAEAFGYPQEWSASKLQRWYQDWQGSSPGRSGALPEDHWVLEMREGVFRGEPYSEGIPRWVTPRCLPEFDDNRLWELGEMGAWLQEFDRQAGGDFSWYFYMLHGNRIPSVVGQRIAEAAETGLTGLAAHDRAVLHAWALQPYSF